MTPTPFTPSYLPETPSQTAGPYVHIGLIPMQAGFEIFEILAEIFAEGFVGVLAFAEAFQQGNEFSAVAAA